MTGITFAIADLHGRFDLLSYAYAEMIDYADGPATIVHLGDYVDRGPESRDIIEFLMDPDTTPSGWKRVVLKGNHEDMMSVCVRGQAEIGWWLGNGGGATLVSYGQKYRDQVDRSVVPPAHLDWIDHLPLIHVDWHRVYVHAAVDPTIPLDQQKEQTLLWQLYANDFPFGHGNYHVVHGHHQFADGPKLFDGRTDLDTFAWYTGRLVVGVFDDEKPGGPVDLLEVRGPAA